jgi:hypothetical protein
MYAITGAKRNRSFKIVPQTLEAILDSNGDTF